MTVGYKAVGWNRQKKVYDRVLIGGILVYLAAFVGTAFVLRPNATIETLLIRALGTCAFLMLHVILSIGPLARLDRRFLPFLYNRRHFGVAMFVVALGHGTFSTVQFHVLGNVNPLASILTSNPRWDSLTQFPFQVLGLAALSILFAMAATSHDFWLTNLTAPIWKRIHMLVYLAYGLLVMHVALGVLQFESSPIWAGMAALGALWLLALHLTAGFRERAADRPIAGPEKDGFLAACRVDQIPNGRARIATISGERVAIFRNGDSISALSNVCQHQNGPLGEGRVGPNGCAVCPWHGYEYQLDTGRSPAPFTEKVPTFNVQVADGTVWVDPVPNPAGTRVEPALANESAGAIGSKQDDGDFYIGYQPKAPPNLAGFVRRAVVVVLLAAAGLGSLLAATQGAFSTATFEYGTVREFSGVLTERPYPVLRTDGEPPQVLVGVGKLGAGELVRDADGRRVELSGTRIDGDGLSLVEVVRDSVKEGSGAFGPLSTVSRGVHKLRGEIVDSKCYFGVMKPGYGKAHRSCAARCISGGIPPVLVLDPEASANTLEGPFLLVDEHFEPVNDRVLDKVAEPVEIEGEIVEREGLLYLKAAPAGYRRVAPH